MNADEIRRALFPHEETIKRLQAEIEELKAQVETLTKELANAKAEPVQEEAPRAKRSGKAKTESHQSDDLGADS